VYLIKQGKIKLTVDIYDLLPQEDDTKVFDEGDVEQEVREIQSEQHLVPFIAYIEGSYFGDTDILCKEKINHDRDSTAKADEECEFLVITHEVIS
jgi:hypothetical protein